MKYLVLVTLLSISSVTHSQKSISQLLAEIESNNLQLKAIRAQTDATIVGNKTGLNPANPQIEYIHQWGNTEQLGNKQEFHIRQSFDFPTAYRYRKQMTASLSEKAEHEYLVAYNRLMFDAQQVIYRLIFQNLLIVEYQKRLVHADRIAQSYHVMFVEGEVNILERNKADVNLLNVSNKVAQIQSDAVLLNEQLKQMNGGHDLTINLSAWPVVSLPHNFDDWFKDNEDIIPELQRLQDGIDASKYNEKLSRAMTMPKLTGGYSAESGTVDKFKGLNLGISIPLWENRNTVKQAQLQTIAIENQLADAQLKLYHGLKALYNKAVALNSVASDYRESLLTINNEELLQVALNSGEISILEFILEQSIYYESLENALKTELELQLSLCQMLAFQVIPNE